MSRDSLRIALGAIAVVVISLVLPAGCATTQPWEREDLAREVMRPDADEEEEGLRHHILSTREGTSGGFGGGGGGCGCN